MKVQAKTIERIKGELGEGGGEATPSPACEELIAAGKLTAEEAAALEPVEAIVETMFLMMGADGAAAREELDLIWDAAKGLAGPSVSGEAVKRLVSYYVDQLKRDGWTTRLRAVGAGLSEDRVKAEAAFALAAAVAMADQVVSLEENVLVDQLAEVLAIDDARCCEILDQVKAERGG